MPAVSINPAAAKVASFQLPDGSALLLERFPHINEQKWNELQRYFEANPDVAQELQSFSQHPDEMRRWLQAQAIEEYYRTMIKAGSPSIVERMKAAEYDAETKAIFAGIKEGGMEAAVKYHGNVDTMRELSKRIGGVPVDLQVTLKRIEDLPFTIHEACKNGNLKAVKESLKNQTSINGRDHNGVAPLAYAIATNRETIVKLLAESRADLHNIDSKGNSAAHYAAGYGRRAVLEYLRRNGAKTNEANFEGQTPLAVACQNQQKIIVALLNNACGAGT